MFIANKLGGLSLGEGDNLRKAMDGASKILKKKLEGEILTEDEEKNKNYKNYKKEIFLQKHPLKKLYHTGSDFFLNFFMTFFFFDFSENQFCLETTFCFWFYYFFFVSFF